ncbi:MAG: phosphate ABC transporter permease subunit PstC, partial [Kurthia sp.]|nr:phosphate ABC transporter permease subunit PstC [Kurthia sp.]
MSTNKAGDKLNVQSMIEQHKNKGMKKFVEKLMPKLLFITALVSVLATIGIVFTLIFETFEFFRR